MSRVEKLVPMVRRMAFRFHPRVFRTVDREDLLQEGYLGLLEAESRYEPDRGSSLSTWGARRAGGAMLDHVRVLSRRSRERTVDEISPRQDFERSKSIAASSPESRQMLIRFGRFLKAGWRELPGVLRDVVRMRFLEGASTREAAASLGCSAATIVRRERQALAELRQGFEACGYGRDL